MPMGRRKSAYRLPKFKLKPQTVTTVGTLVAFALTCLSAAALFSHSESLSFWKEILSLSLGWVAALTPLLFLVAGLVLLKLKWKFAQPNVLVGLLVIMVSLSGILGFLAQNHAGFLGNMVWVQLNSLMTAPLALPLLLIIFFIGFVVTFNVSINQILGLFAAMPEAMPKVSAPKLSLPNVGSFEDRKTPIKLSGIEDPVKVKTPVKTVEEKTDDG